MKKIILLALLAMVFAIGCAEEEAIVEEVAPVEEVAEVAEPPEPIEIETLEGAEVQLVVLATNVSSTQYQFSGRIVNTGEIDLSDVELRIDGPIGIKYYELDFAREEGDGNELAVDEAVPFDYVFYGHTNIRDGVWRMSVYEGTAQVAIKDATKPELTGMLEFMTMDEQLRRTR